MRNKLVMGVIALVMIIAVTGVWHFSKKPEKPHKISGALKALNLWSRQRAYPNDFIPAVGHYAAFKLSKQKLNKSTTQITVPPWEAIGPHNMGGRTLALAFNPLNPNTIYAGSASGGLWRSYTGGVGAEAWEYVATGFPVLAVSSIAIAPDDSNTIYIGTGEVYNYQAAGTGAAYRATRGTYGIGILKTTDGGLTWSPSLDWSYNQEHGVWAVKINPLNPNTVWAATTEGTYKSTDGGTTWSRVHDVIMATDLVINPIDTNVVIIGCGNFGSEGHGIYRTIDGGSTWTKPTVGLPATFNGKAMLSISKTMPQFVFASIGNGFSSYDGATWLCLSGDGGENWSIASTQDYSLWQGWFAHDVAVDPSDFVNVIAVGIDIWKSNSLGSDLEQKSLWYRWWDGLIPPGNPEGPPNYSHADHHDVVFHPTNPEIIYFANDGGVFRSMDGGETFEGCNGGYQTTQFYNGFSCSQQDSMLAMGGMQDNGTIIYRGSTTWDRLVIGGDGCWTAIDATNDNVMYGSWQYLKLMKSTNSGRNWFGVTPPQSNGPTTFIAPFIVGIDNPDVIYAGRDIVYKSTNGGRSWTATNGGSALDGSPVFAMAISHQSSDVVYAATAPLNGRPNVFRTDTGGQFWVNITSTLPDRFPTDIAVDPNDDSIVYITFSGFGTSHVFKSTDSGNNWQNIGQGLPDLPANAVIVDPKFPQNIYIGNDLGVYASTDGGDSWQEFLDGLPDAVIAMDLSICPVNRKLRLATHGNGAYERKLLEGYPVDVADVGSAPTEFELEQNYPNPFNTKTRIYYSLEKSNRVALSIYNSLGQEVKTLINNQFINAGKHVVFWDGRDNSGSVVTTGTYIYRLQAGDQILSKEMTFVK